MTNPYDPLERELRRSLAERAQDAPDAHALTERLLAAGSGTRTGGGDAWTPARRRGWTAWGTPLVAAACVALIVGVVLAIVRPGHSDRGPVADGSPSRPVPVSSPVSPAPSTPSNASSDSVSAASTDASKLLKNLRIVDLTFVGENTGWALASADCVTGSGRCTALLRTTDGTRWDTFTKSTPFDVSGVRAGCPAAKCVTNIRFADESVGYAYGPEAMYLTQDGGLSWTKLSGGADALETLNNNVIRVSSPHTGCPGPCDVTVQTAALGSPVFTTRQLDTQPVDAVQVQLIRVGSSAVLRVGQQAHAGAVPYGPWYVSTDDGLSWRKRTDPCSTVGASAARTSTGAVDMAPAPASSVVALCIGGGSNANVGVTVAGAVAGTAFTAGSRLPRTSVEGSCVAVASTGTALVGADKLYRTTDGGASWSPVTSVDISGGVTFAGFETTMVGRLVTDGGRTIWTTRDAGATWTSVSF